MGRAKRWATQKEYKAWYYATKVKPFRSPKTTLTSRTMFQCPMCLKSSRPASFSQPFHSKIGVLLYRGGNIGIEYKNVSSLNSIYTDKLMDFLQNFSLRAVDFVNYAIEMKWITEQQVAYMLRLITPEQFNLKIQEVNEIWQKQKVVNISYPQITSKQNVKPIMRGGSVLSGLHSVGTRYSKYPKQLKNVQTLNLLRKPEQI